MRSETCTTKYVENVLKVLEVISESNQHIQLSRLSEKLDMDKSSVYRLLQTFVSRGYLERISANGRYQLGLAAYTIGQNIVSRMELLSAAKPSMEMVVRKCDETVYLVMRQGNEVLFFESLDTLNPVRVMPLKGRYYPLSCCAAGNVLWAFCPIVDGWSATETLADDEGPLGIIRAQGFSSDVHCLGEGIASLAVPIINNKQTAVGSLCIVSPESRLQTTRINEELFPLLRDAGYATSIRLGCVQ